MVNGVSPGIHVLKTAKSVQCKNARLSAGE